MSKKSLSEAANDQENFKEWCVKLAKEYGLPDDFFENHFKGLSEYENPSDDF